MLLVSRRLLQVRGSRLQVSEPSGPDRLPVLAMPTMLRASADFHPVRGGDIAVAAARAASAAVMDSQLDQAERAGRLDRKRHCAFGLLTKVPVPQFGAPSNAEGARPDGPGVPPLLP